MSVRRTSAVVGERLDLRMMFRYADTGVLFDPYSVDSVVIFADDGVTVLETIAVVARISVGYYQVLTSALWNVDPQTVIDKWMYHKTSTSGSQQAMSTTIIFQSVVPPTPTPTSLPVASDVRALLEGFCVTEGLVSDDFINDSLTDEIIPFVENFTRNSFTGVKTVVELHSGTGRDTMLLDRKNIIALTRVNLVSGNDIDTVIQLSSLLLQSARGQIKVKSGLSEYYNYRIFPKGNDNIQVTYTYGSSVVPRDIFKAIAKLGAVLVLDNLSDRTGGGDLTTEGFSRKYSDGMGKYGNIRRRFSAQAMAILKRYSSAVVGA